MTASFMLDGRECMALNGGPRFKFTATVSFLIKCETQEPEDKDREKARRVMQAMLQMGKIDIAKLQTTNNGAI